ncbi:hypothetical protein R1sor_009484 [Riccia sorocarpa]|uniref:Uncharacterized protein n=1 Tax=Riccia sorocarpa TaxID=122646 RepID=A0ABD3HVH6_9MARC
MPSTSSRCCSRAYFGPYIFHVLSRYGELRPLTVGTLVPLPVLKKARVMMIEESKIDSENTTNSEVLVQTKTEPQSGFHVGSTSGVKGPQEEYQTLTPAGLKLEDLGGLLLHLKDTMRVFSSLQQVMAGKDLETADGVASALRRMFTPTPVIHSTDLAPWREIVSRLVTTLIVERQRRKIEDQRGLNTKNRGVSSEELLEAYHVPFYGVRLI